MSVPTTAVNSGRIRIMRALRPEPACPALRRARSHGVGRPLTRGGFDPGDVVGGDDGRPGYENGGRRLDGLAEIKRQHHDGIIALRILLGVEREIELVRL